MTTDSEAGLLRELAGWRCITEDLNFVMSATRSLELQESLPHKDGLLTQALWLAAQIAYSRCFVTGPTVRLEVTMFDRMVDGRAQAHRFLLHTANRHLAQPINPARRVAVSIDRSRDGKPEGITYSPIKGDDGFKDFANLSWLAAEALKHVERIETGLVARLKNLLQSDQALRPVSI